MNVNDRGLALIAEFEGFSAVPYNDPVGHCTVGYGELLHPGNCTAEELARAPITEEQGYAALRVKVQPYADAVDQSSRPLNQNEFDALTSLCYNIGPGGYRNSAVRTAVNNGGDVCAALRQIVHGTDGVVYPGLVRRREAECELFNTPEEGRMYSDEVIDGKVFAVLTALVEANKKLDALQTSTEYLIKIVTNIAPRVAALEAKP